jgi:ubiquinol-cytochrome c reductase iron-sulfur subunit
MRYVSVYILAIASLVAFAMQNPLSAEIEPGAAVKPDACAGDTTKLGVSRTVEIETTGGVDVGGDKADAKQFLNDGEVVLTFDDGPMRSDTKPIIKALADQCTKATFFMVGQMALADPEMVKEVAAGGNTVGSHTWSHKNIRAISLDRAKQEIEAAQNVPLAELPDPQADSARVKKPEWLVVVGVCTHLGCIPTGHEGEFHGWFCPCHGSTYDTSGRIRSGPAPSNLEVPDYAFLSDTKIKIG